MNQKTDNRRILLIDGELGWLEFGKRTLSEAGYVVEIAEKATYAWKLLKEGRFDLILIDLNVVEQEEDIICQLTINQRGRGTHSVILFPVDLTPAKMRKLFKMGVYDCVDKQYDAAGLIGLVVTQFAEIRSNKPVSLEVHKNEQS